MKKKYEKVRCRIFVSEQVDVITASDGTAYALDKVWNADPWGSFNGGDMS